MKSVIPCTNGILIRPKLDEILTSRSTNLHHSSQSSLNLNSATAVHHSTTLNTHSSFSNSSDKPIVSTAAAALQTGINLAASSSQCNISNSSYNMSYIVNTINNEIVEIKFPDEQTRNNWATLVHTHITPFIVAQQTTNLTTESGSTSTLRHQSSNASNSSGCSSSAKTTVVKSTSSGPLLTANTYRCNSNIR